jgi:hypothetical protein
MVHARLLGNGSVSCEVALALCISGLLISNVSHQQASTSGVNPADLFGITGWTAETAVVLEANYQGFAARTRAVASVRNGSTRTDLRFQELSWRGQIAGNWVLTLGKTQLQWDTAQSIQPVGFFQRDVDIADVTDSAGRSEGLPLAAITWLGDGLSVSAAFSDDTGSQADGFNRGLRQAAVRVSVDVHDTSYAFIGRWVDGDGVGLGATLSTPLTETLLFNASLYAEQGSRRPIHRLVFSEIPGLATEDPNQPLRAVTDALYVRAAAGVNLGLPGGLTFAAELTHDSAGLSPAQWRRFLALISLHSNTLANPALRGRAIANLGWDARAFIRSGARQSYAYGRVAWRGDATDLSLTARIGLADGAWLASVRAGWRLNAHWDTAATASLFQGARTSEYGQGLIRAVWGVQARLNF